MTSRFKLAWFTLPHLRTTENAYVNAKIAIILIISLANELPIS